MKTEDVTTPKAKPKDKRIRIRADLRLAIKRIQLVLLYQGELANVMERSRVKQNYTPPTRVYQGTYEQCEMYCQGARHARAIITVQHYDHAGDALEHISEWRDGAGGVNLHRKHFRHLLLPL